MERSALKCRQPRDFLSTDVLVPACDQHGANFGLTNRIIVQVDRGSAPLGGFAYEAAR
jgi:hypothetical protein